MIAKIYADSFGLDIIQTRSFTHFGAYQKENFILAKFAKDLTLIKKNEQPPVLSIGNIDLIRDLTDVRDVINAYALLLKKGKTGEIYNVCSGKGRSLRDVLDAMLNKLSVKVELKVDEKLLRKGDIQSIIGSNKKLKSDTGWEPKISFEQSIDDLLGYWNEKD
jgi:GDP-4-dehydro-6-deoxy-D-mannose reductase